MSQVAAVAQAMAAYRRKLEKDETLHEHWQSQVSQLTQTVADLERQRDLLEQVTALLGSLGDQAQEDLQTQLQTIVTYGLRSIFGGDMELVIDTGKHGTFAAADFRIRSTDRGETLETSIMDARGGGVAAVAGFLLRLMILLLSGRPPVMLLDETFAQLSADYEPALAEFMRELVDKTGAQIVLVTHSDLYSDVADKVYRLTNTDGTTHVTTE
jgi:DNA repair exonuclease SbcCD ATPase subunit